MTTQLERFLDLLPPRHRVHRVDIRLQLTPLVRALVPLRNGDCKSLTTCEDTWIAWNGEAQARCPERCRAYRLAPEAPR